VSYGGVRGNGAAGSGPRRLAVPSGERVEVDGADADRSVLVECWAHQGPPKSAQRHKVLADAFKLTWVSTTMYPKPRLILCLSDPLAAAPFLPGARSWAARAFQDLGVTISVVDLPAELRQDLLQAQRRQYRQLRSGHPDPRILDCIVARRQSVVRAPTPSSTGTAVLYLQSGGRLRGFGGTD
jgi:hypothetical protein